MPVVDADFGSVSKFKRLINNLDLTGFSKNA